jgi:hypothetical protein
VINKKLYVAGGSSCDACSPGAGTLTVYDPVTDTWTTKASMTKGRQAPAGATAQGKFYVIGGTTAYAGSGVSRVEVYTP